MRPLAAALTLLLLSGCNETRCWPRGRQLAKESALKHDLFEMRKAIDDFYADNHRYPETPNELVTAKYVRRIPADPITGRTDTWRWSRTNIKSGAPGTGCDGTRYSEW